MLPCRQNNDKSLSLFMGLGWGSNRDHPLTPPDPSHATLHTTRPRIRTHNHSCTQEPNGQMTNTNLCASVPLWQYHSLNSLNSLPSAVSALCALCASVVKKRDHILAPPHPFHVILSHTTTKQSPHTIWGGRGMGSTQNRINQNPVKPRHRDIREHQNAAIYSLFGAI